MRSILDVMSTLFASLFSGPSWEAWRGFLCAVFALPMSEAQAVTVRACTGRDALPMAPARQAWMIVGRRGGKSRIAALLAVFCACFRRYSLAHGERGIVMVIAADRRQARVVFRYIRALIDSVDMLAGLVDRQTKEALHLKNGISIEVHTASFRAVRGYSIVAAILDEIAFWPTDDAANPDDEIIAALLPAMAMIPDSLLVALSSPYARRGELWRAFEQHFGKDGDPVLVWQADTRTMNPRMPQDVIDRAYADDEASASAEYGAQFRRDVEQLVAKEIIDANTMPGRSSLPAQPGIEYFAFTDPSGGSGSDSFTLAIAHNEGDRRVLDLVLERKPPLSPEETTAEFAATLRAYGITRVRGDHYAGLWPREQFQRHGITYETAEKSKADIYRELLPLLNSRKAELLDHPRLLRQLAGLERRTSRGGRDSIDHAPGVNCHDDVINAAAGALVNDAGGSWGARATFIKTTGVMPVAHEPRGWSLGSDMHAMNERRMDRIGVERR